LTKEAVICYCLPTALTCVSPLLKGSASTLASNYICMSTNLALQLSATYMLKAEI